jgi:hypothetical protein
MVDYPQPGAEQSMVQKPENTQKEQLQLHPNPNWRTVCES